MLNIYFGFECCYELNVFVFLLSNSVEALPTDVMKLGDGAFGS